MKRRLCVFLKNPEPGRVKTRLAAELGTEKAAEIYHQLVCEVFRQIKKANPDEIAVFYTPTESESAVEKLARTLDP